MLMIWGNRHSGRSAQFHRAQRACPEDAARYQLCGSLPLVLDPGCRGMRSQWNSLCRCVRELSSFFRPENS
jgi:hypothetical protein